MHRPRGAIIFNVALVTPKLTVAALLVVAAVLWVLFNGPVEGRTLIVVTPNHGLTEADLLSVAAVGLASILVLTDRHQLRRSSFE